MSRSSATHLLPSLACPRHSVYSNHCITIHATKPPLSQARVLVNGAGEDVRSDSNSTLDVRDWGSWVCLLPAYSLGAAFC